jgi:hypothetical protein
MVYKSPFGGTMSRYLCFTALSLWGASALWADAELPGEIAMEVFFGEQKGEKKKKSMENNPSGRGCVASNNIYITGDFIYWKAVEDDIEEIVARSPNVLTPQGNLGLVQMPTMHFSYNPGFEVGVGANMNYGDWDVFGNWTRLRSHNTTAHTSEINEFIILPLVAGTGTLPVASRYKSRWKLNYDTFDFELGRAFVLSKRVIMRPYVGGRAVWVYRSIESHFYGLNSNYQNFFSSSGPLNGPIDLDFRNEFWGLGPRLGLNSRWLLGNSGFGLMANIAGSFDAGPFKNKTVTTVYGPSETLEGKILVKRLFTTRANVDAAIGLDYGKCFDWLYMYFSIGYDVSYWWNMLSTMSYSETTSNKTDLSLRGLDIRARLDF